MSMRRKQVVEFPDYKENGVIKTGKSFIMQPKTNFKYGSIKWLDDTVKEVDKKELEEMQAEKEKLLNLIADMPLISVKHFSFLYAFVCAGMAHGTLAISSGHEEEIKTFCASRAVKGV